MPRERMRDLELPAYMRALAEARQRIAEESSDRLNELADNVEWLDTVAEALGIATSAEDWWDSIIEQKRTKIIGRIAVLRELRPTQETRKAPACSYCEDEPGYCKVCGGITCPIVGCKIKGKHEHTIVGPEMNR